jgi:hypothetical protein
MTRTRSLITAPLAALSLSLALAAQAAEDPHHPAGDAGASAPAAATPAPPAGSGQPAMGQGTMGMGMMGGQRMMAGQGMMGQGMMSMMQMMHRMQMGDDAPGMGMVDRVEGRIAFLQAELKITPAQTAAWNAFAVALRSNAQRLAGPRMAMMGANQTMAQRLEAQERWLSARLEGTRALRTAHTTLYASLSDEQKRVADELLGSHMGMMQMGGMGGQGAH